MISANWLTLTASLVTLLSVVLSYFVSKKQIKNTNELALKQIQATATETSRRLRAEILLKEKQSWIKEFRDAINELLYIGDPYLDKYSEQSLQDRMQQVTRLAHKVDLMMPVGESHAALSNAITPFADHLLGSGEEPMIRERLQLASTITILTRQILRDELKAVESSI